MDNLDKIVPLIVILVSFVVSIVNNVKKEAAKKQQSAQKKTSAPAGQQPVSRPQQVPRPNPVVRSQIPDQSRHKTAFPKETRPVVKQPYQFPEPSFRPAYNPEEVEKVVSVFSSEQADESNENNLINEITANENPILDVQNAEEIKRAIIYAEILGRKYE